MLRRSIGIIPVIILSLFLTTEAKAADQTLKPYILGYQGPGTIEEKLPGLRNGLEKKGFQVIGEYEPYKGARILAVTNDALKAAAANSDFGAYGAIIRVSITDTGKELQIAATNPRYYAAAYRMRESLNDVAASLEEAVGKTAEFGSRDGMTASPVTISRTDLATEALNIMEDKKITSLVIKNGTNKVEGVVHLHDLWRTEMF